jgi:hypothetical protein
VLEKVTHSHSFQISQGRVIVQGAHRRVRSNVGMAQSPGNFVLDQGLPFKSEPSAMFERNDGDRSGSEKGSEAVCRGPTVSSNLEERKARKMRAPSFGRSMNRFSRSSLRRFELASSSIVVLRSARPFCNETEQYTVHISLKIPLALSSPAPTILTAHHVHTVYSLASRCRSYALSSPRSHAFASSSFLLRRDSMR